MASSKTSKASYEDTIKSLVLLDPARTVGHKMASLTSTTELCRRHIAGLCTNGSSCKYSHESASPTKRAPSDKKPNKNPPPPFKKDQKTPPKFPFKKPIVVSDSHRSLVGYPNGVASAKNPAGYSLNQLTAIRTLQPTDVDGWTSGDPQYFQEDESSHHIDRFNTIRFQLANPEIIPEFPEFYFIQPFPRLQEIRRNLYTILNSVETYKRFAGTSDDDYDGSSKDHYAGIVVAFQDLTSSAIATSEPKMSYLFVDFTWHSEVPYISRAVNTREDVRTADKRLMRMIYKIGYRFLGADVIIPEREGSQNFNYMKFNPTSDSFYHSDDEGLYQSNIISIERHFIAIRYIMEHPDIPWRSLRVIFLVIIYDFMSFCAQLLRDAVYMLADIIQTRSNVAYALKTYRANIVYVDQVIFHNAFSAIISCIKPVPPIPNRFVKQTSSIKTSYSWMSAIDREEQLSETTDHTEAYGDDEESNDSYGNDESSSDEDMSPPSSSSAHHRRCNESLALGNPFVMGHKRSLWTSLQSDTKRPARKRVSRPRPFQDEYEEEIPGTSSSKDAPPYTPLSKTNVAVPHLPSPAMVQPPIIDAVQVQINDELQSLVRFDQPPIEEEMQPSMQDVMHPPMQDIISQAPIKEMCTRPIKSPDRESLSATRRAKTRALSAKKELNLLPLTSKDSKLMSFKKSSHKTVIDRGASTSGTGQRGSLRDLRPT